MPTYSVNYSLKDANDKTFKSGVIKIEADSATQAEIKARQHFYNNGEIDYLAQASVRVAQPGKSQFNDIGDR